MMGLQLVFAVETNRKCNSDWIYIKDTIEHFYKYDGTQVKLTPVYMEGRGNYKKKEKQIMRLTKQYSAMSKANHSVVLYCFDCDDYDSNPDDRRFLEEVRQYCNEKGYEFVWFCKDVEQVYIGKRVDDSQKKAQAVLFKEKKLIDRVGEKQLSADRYQEKNSNIMRILDRSRELTRKKMLPLI